jgi:hypothetical protein
MSGALPNLEIEHKFLIDNKLDKARLFSALNRHQPKRVASAQVIETYFLTQATPNLIYRHRYDENNQDLTYKTFGAGDIEVRQEVRLALTLTAGNQVEQVRAFLAPLGIRWQGGLTKSLEVFEFADCEVVHYVAKTDDKVITCVEFEALSVESVESARATLLRYEEQFGFADKARCRQSLFELLFQDKIRS